MKRGYGDSEANSPRKKAKCAPSEELERCPIWDHQSQLLTAIFENDLTIFIGSPGLGLGSQLPQMVLESRLNGFDTVGIVHTSSASAIMTAKAVAEEMGVKVGDLVGFKTRFETRCRGPRTKLKFLTDDCLLREMLVDEMLQSYSIIMLDDVHKRSWRTDVLLRFLRRMCERRQQLGMSCPKLVLMGYLMDTTDLIAFFDMLKSRVVFLSNAPSSEHKLRCKELDSDLQVDHVVTTVRTVMLLLKNHPQGDILCFLASRSEVFNGCFLARYLLSPSRSEDLPSFSLRPRVFSLYEGMPDRELRKAIGPAPEGCRKIIFCDSIGESSIQIEGVRIVVDSGYCQVKDFLELPSIPTLGLEKISAAQAWFREMRARAEGRGLVYRVYSHAQLAGSVANFPGPELTRVSLAPVVLFSLKMKCNAYTFPSPCQHFVNQFTAAIYQLLKLDAITERGDPSRLKLTLVGEMLVRLPLEVPAARALVASAELGCSAELLTIAAMLSVGPIFHDFGRSPKEFQKARRSFATPHGDCVSLLMVYRGYREAAAQKTVRCWCRKRCINSSSLRLAFQFRRRLRSTFRSLGLPVRSCGEDFSRVTSALTTGYIFCLARHQRMIANGTVHHGYRSVFSGHQLELSHDSALFGRTPPEFLVHLDVEEIHGGGREIRLACPVNIAFAHCLYPGLVSESGDALEEAAM